MAKFKVTSGHHVEKRPDWEGDPLDPERYVRHEKGSVVESDRPLDRLFQNKFERLRDEAQTAPASPQRRTAVNTMIEQGEWTEDDRDFLEGLTDDRFVRIQSRASRADQAQKAKREGQEGQKAQKGPSGQEKDSPAGRPPEEAAPESPLGEDVTEDFPKAKDAGLRVWRNAVGKHQVTEGDSQAPANKEPLDQGKVNKFVDQFRKESNK